MLIIWENIFKMCVCKYLLSSVTLFLFPLSLSTSIPLFQSLSLAERKELLEAWVEQKEHCPTIMAQVSWSPDQHHQGHEPDDPHGPARAGSSVDRAGSNYQAKAGHI